MYTLEKTAYYFPSINKMEVIHKLLDTDRSTTTNKWEKIKDLNSKLKAMTAQFGNGL